MGTGGHGYDTSLLIISFFHDASELCRYADPCRRGMIPLVIQSHVEGFRMASNTCIFVLRGLASSYFLHPDFSIFTSATGTRVHMLGHSYEILHG